MKTLLLLPPLSKNGNNNGLIPRFAPYISASVAAHIKKSFSSVAIFDAFLEKASFQDIILKINKYRPDIIGVPLVEVNREVPMETILSMIQYVKTNNPENIIVVFGSKDLGLLLSYIEQNDSIDYCIAGDPEEIVPDLIKALDQNDQSKIRTTEGLIYKNGNKIVFTGERIVNDLDQLEFPAWDLVTLNNYSPLPHRYNNIKFYPLTSSRGCCYIKTNTEN